jgi:CrcB protein
MLPALDPREVMAVFAGGCVGALARAGLAEAVVSHPGRWPWVTFGVNVAGAALLGYFVTRLGERLPPARYRRPFLATGTGCCRCAARLPFSRRSSPSRAARGGASKS